MFRWLIRPEILFLLGIAQALSPYAMWALGWGVTSTGIEVSSDPIILWLCAYAAFWLGTVSVRKGRLSDSETKPPLRGKQVIVASVIMIAVVIVLSVWAISVYGTLPILSYLVSDNQINVGDANDLQESGTFGQFGLLLVSSVLANGVLLTLLIWNVYSSRRTPLLLTFFTAVLIFANVLNGKRQGLLILGFYLMVGLTLYVRNPFDALAALNLFPRRKLLRAALVLLVFPAAISFSGYIGRIRTQGASEQTATDEAIRYLEFPLRNFAAQCEQAGLYGPSYFDALYPLQHLLPERLVKSSLSNSIPEPNRAEPTSPAGMFEAIHWGWGVVGIALYAALLGAVCSYVFQHAKHSTPCALIYPLLAYGLFTAHTYNHFLNLAFIPVPSVLLLLYGKWLNKSRIVTQSASS